MRRIGIDLALRAPHRAAVFDDAAPVGRAFRFESTKEGLDTLERRARDGAQGPCEFIMEPTGLAWVAMAAELARRGHRVYAPKPLKTHALRKFYSAYAKTDGIDAQAQALVRHVDPKGVHELPVPTPEQTTLRLCVKQRARLVAEAAKSKSRIKSWLVLANPHLTEALDGEAMFSTVGTAFLRRFVNPFEARARGKSQMRQFWLRQTHGPCDDRQFEAVWQACETTCALYEGLRAAQRLPFEYRVVQELVCQELEHIEHLEQSVSALEETIRRLYKQLDPERVLERELPGVGATIAPAIEAFAGDVERFGSVKRFASYFGVVPRTRQSGDKDKPRQRLTKGGPNLLKQYVFLAAETARRNDPELAATYDRAIARGKHHFSAVMTVAHKLVRRIYAVLKLRAAARGALEQGRPVEQVPQVTYRRINLDDGTALSATEARAYVSARFPTKAARATATTKKAAPVSHSTGSSKDATNGTVTAPPTHVVPNPVRGGNPEGNPVHIASILRRILPLDSP
jgi:transposase